jgi:hypothetical protein
LPRHGQGQEIPLSEARKLSGPGRAQVSGGGIENGEARILGDFLTPVVARIEAVDPDVIFLSSTRREIRERFTGSGSDVCERTLRWKNLRVCGEGGTCWNRRVVGRTRQWCAANNAAGPSCVTFTRSSPAARSAGRPIVWLLTPSLRRDISEAGPDIRGPCF